eukprot:33836_6
MKSLVYSADCLIFSSVIYIANINTYKVLLLGLMFRIRQPNSTEEALEAWFNLVLNVIVYCYYRDVERLVHTDTGVDSWLPPRRQYWNQKV